MRADNPRIPIYYSGDRIGEICIRKTTSFPELFDQVLVLVMSAHPECLEEPTGSITIVGYWDGQLVDSAYRIVTEANLFTAMQQDVLSFSKWLLGAEEEEVNPLLTGRKVIDHIVSGPSIDHRMDVIDVMAIVRVP